MVTAMDSSPARALETKKFSSEYWRWKHRFLVHALHQYGYPTLFVTINPYEWTFLFACWLEEFRDRTGKAPPNWQRSKCSNSSTPWSKLCGDTCVVPMLTAGRTISFGTRQGPHPQMCSATSTGSSSRTGAHCISIFSSGSRMSPRYQSTRFMGTSLGRTASWHSWCWTSRSWTRERYT